MEKHLQLNEIPIVIGLGFGDEGKGTIVDFLCQQRRTDYVMRFSGGPQTAHNVVTRDGIEHTFALFGSGTFQGAGTILTKHVLVNPYNLISEARALEAKMGKNPLATMLLSENALLITPLHVLANEQREINRGRSPHGSCGQGVGEARSYAIHQTSDDPITLKDLLNLPALRVKLEAMWQYFMTSIPDLKDSPDFDELLSTYEALMTHENLNIVSDEEILGVIGDPATTLVVEGSQGVLLDEDFGFIPHTTWSSVVSRNAKDLLREAGIPEDNMTVIGITRTYTTRHGAGPFPSEINDDTLKALYPEKHNSWGRFQGGWRVGALDVALLDYAVRVSGGIDYIALTHCDVTPVREAVVGWERIFEPAPRDPEYRVSALTDTVKSVQHPVVEEYENIHQLTGLLHRRTGVRVGILSYGPTAEDKRWV